jgi:hypothetical protein
MTRYYCPECGEVHNAFRFSLSGIPAPTKAVVPPHDRYYREYSYFHPDKHHSRCPGGPVDLEKDKAP